MTDKKAIPEQESAIANLLFNVALPVIVLRQLGKRLGEDGPVIALCVALAFPICYGLRDFMRRKKVNIFSVVGFVGILLTGGFALLKLGPEWFVWKEAGVPALLGLVVLGSCATRNPFCRLMFHTPALLQLDRIEEKVPADDPRWLPLWRTTTAIIAGSFFLSAVLNYFLAVRVFTGIDQTLEAAAQAEMLNAQIAKMTWQGYVIIMAPCMLCMVGALVWMLRGIKQLTGLTTEEVLAGTKHPDPETEETPAESEATATRSQPPEEELAP